MSDDSIIDDDEDDGDDGVKNVAVVSDGHEGSSAATDHSCAGYNYDSTSIRRPFDCLSKLIKMAAT